MWSSTPRTWKVAAVTAAVTASSLVLAACGTAERGVGSADGASAALLVSPGASAPGPGVEEARAAGACSAGPVERRPLVLADGTHAYVEPTAFMRVGEAPLLVGSPSYTWELGGDVARQTSVKAHIAAYLDGERPRLVPNPFGADVDFIRAVALDAGRWAVLASYRRENAVGQVRTTALRYAEYAGAWSPLEDVPLPPLGVSVATSSELVRHGSELLWVAVDESARGGVYEYRRRDGAWSIERLFESGLEAAALDVGPSGPWLAVKGLDPGVQGPRKSVRLFHWDGGWTLVTRDPTQERYTEIDNLELLALPGGAAVTWVERTGVGVARARLGVRPDDPGSPVVLDETAPMARSFATSSGQPGWVLHHVEASSGDSDLRLVLARSGSLGADPSVFVAAEIPLPYTGPFDAIATGPTEVLVTGAEFSPDPARATVRSLTLRLNPSCR